MAIDRWRRFYRSPDDDCAQALLDAARTATTSLHILIYGFTLESLADILIAKHHAGLAVGIVADHTQAAGHAERPLLQKLIDSGVPVVIATSPTGAINHQKALLVDQALGATHNLSCAVYGSWNFSEGANAQENFLIVDNDPSICDDLWAQYQETLAWGLKHPQWQLYPTASASASSSSSSSSSPSPSPSPTLSTQETPS